ncbi:MAG TPA: hypothetical protein VKA27_13605 [Sunxiuqinia sp.]|nr:hypothetical protein [Sunxiuqinia sp.]
MNKIKLLILLIAIFSISSCVHDNGFEPPQNQTIYFQFEYQNHAWGPQHRGFIIDQQGNIYDYNKPENWTFPEKDQISREDFNNNLEQTQVRLTQISGTELQRMLNLVYKAKNGDLTEQKSVMADAGEDTYCIYIGNEGDQKLTKYVLQIRGDFYQKNTSAAADTITNWLIGFRNGPVFGPEPFEN